MGRLERCRTGVFAAIERLPSERVALSTAVGPWLAEPVLARRDAAAFACSAMVCSPTEGYAVCAIDVAGPARLQVALTLFAGNLTGEPVEAWLLGDDVP